MKKYISIIIIILMIGIGSAQNYMPEFTMEPDAGIEMDSTTPGDIEMWGGEINNATIGTDLTIDDNFITGINKTSGNGVLVGFTPDCDFIVDGTDDCVEIQAAIDYMYSNYLGGKVSLQSGNYNITNQIYVKNWVTLEGANVPFRGYHPGAWDNAKLLDNYVSTAHTKFWITNTTDSAFLMGHGTTLRNVQFAYPSQVPNIIPPLVYPAAIQLGSWSSDVLIDYVNCGNAYQFINATASHARFGVTNCVGYPLKTGIVIDGGTDADYLFNVHFDYPYFPESIYPNNSTYLYVWGSATAIEVGRSDHGKATNCFSYGYYRHIFVNDTNDFQIIGGGADNPYVGIEIVSAERIIVDGVKITSVRVPNPWPAGGASITISGGGFNVVSNCIFASDGHGIKSNSYGDVFTGNVICYFGRNATTMHGGIYLYGGQHHIISNNFIRGDSYANTVGIYSTSGNDVVVMGNIIANIAGYGIAITSTNGQIIANHLRSTGGMSNTMSGTYNVTLNNII
jgi:hypothetical protein